MPSLSPPYPFSPLYSQYGNSARKSRVSSDAVVVHRNRHFFFASPDSLHSPSQLLWPEIFPSPHRIEYRTRIGAVRIQVKNADAGTEFSSIFLLIGVRFVRGNPAMILQRFNIQTSPCPSNVIGQRQ
jgi:hypothetical protein